MSRRAYFLELVSGWVEGVGVPPARIALQGHLELASPFPRVTTNYSAVGGGFARVWRCPEGVQLTAVGREAVAMINDAPVHRAVLKHGDLITWGDVTLRFLALDVPEHRDPGLEAAIIATPDDDACWQVYADWLLSVGDPLGERIRGLRPDDSEFLGPLMPLVTEHAVLTLEWSHGFIRSAVLRSWGAVQADELLTWLLELPVARFLSTLEVELRSFASREREGGLPAVLAQVQRVLKDAPLPALEHLVLGPLFVPTEPALAALVRPEHAPRLPPGPYVVQRTGAFLEVDRGLEPGTRPLQEGERIQLYAPPRVHVGAIYWENGWSLFHVNPNDWRVELKLNGRQPTSNWHPLRDGDLIESGDWLRLRFRS